MNQGQITELSQGTYEEAIFSSADGVTLRLITADPETAIAQGQFLDAAFEAAQGRETSTDKTTIDIDESVRDLLALVEGHDASDLLTMLTLNLQTKFWQGAHPQSPTDYSSSAAVLDVVALALASNGMPRRNENCTVRTAEIVPAVVEIAGQIVRYSAFYSNREQDTNHGLHEMALANRVRAAEMQVRGRQYDAVAERINESILGAEQVRELWKINLGYEPSDVSSIRSAVSKALTRCMEDIFPDPESLITQTAPDSDSVTRFVNFLESPGETYIFSARDMAKLSELNEEVCKRLLDDFSFPAHSGDPQAALQTYISGTNPVRGRETIKLSDGRYLIRHGSFAEEEIRRIGEDTIQSAGKSEQYYKRRAKASEDLAVRALTKLLSDESEVHTGLKYRAPVKGQNGVDLSRDSTSHQSVDHAEADALIISDGVAICVEIKSKPLRKAAREGDPKRLQADLNKILREASNQASRLRTLIEDHGGIWLQEGNWLDLGHIRELHSVLVSLDDLGPVSLSTRELLRTGIISGHHIPWVVSLHDLIVISDVIESPSAFLSYLRRRTDREGAETILSADELDLLIWYLRGGLFYYPDPVALKEKYPLIPEPRKKDVQQYKEQFMTIVGTLTHELDQCYQGVPTRPQATGNRRFAGGLEQIVEWLESERPPGRLRIIADIDFLSTDTQSRIVSDIGHIVSEHTRDFSQHSFTTGMTDARGTALFVFVVHSDVYEATATLEAYLPAKKYQMQATRACGIVLGPDGQPVHSLWLDNPHVRDKTMEQEIARRGLVPIERMPRSVPPRVRHASRNSSGRKKKRKKRRH